MNEIIKNAAKDLIELEVLNLLYKDEKIGKALNELSLEERQKIISELRADQNGNKHKRKTKRDH